MVVSLTTFSSNKIGRIFSIKWDVVFFCAVFDRTKKHYLPLIIEKLQLDKLILPQMAGFLFEQKA